MEKRGVREEGKEEGGVQKLEEENPTTKKSKCLIYYRESVFIMRPVSQPGG